MPNPTCTQERDCVIVSTMFLPAAWNCHNNKPYYSLLLTASLQSPRGVVNAEANCALTPLIYTAQDHSAAQVWPPEGQDPGDTGQVASSLMAS